MTACNGFPKHLEDVYLNWPYRISCYSLLHDKLDPIRNRRYMEHNGDEENNWENPMITVSMTIAQISKLQYIAIC